ncbi:MAG: enoyl-CoA hydratase/isomerase family protein [Hyphomicrobiaceae bacterium]
MAEAAVIPVTNGVGDVRSGAAAVVTLDRGGALNALTPAMVARLDGCFRRFARDANLYVVILKSADAKAFCAGGDVRALSALARTDLAAARAALRAEFQLNWLHECFSKPTVALMDGLVMGSGVGISAYATHRVAGPKYKYAMPETAIGYFPDVGVAQGLARLPHHIGRYLGLTGHSIGRADAYALGLVTHCLEAAQFAEVEVGLAEAWPVDPLLDERHRDPGPGPLMGHADAIAHCFGAASVEEVLERLQGVRGESSAFAGKALADLTARSPLALKVALRHIKEAGALDLRQTLEVDFRLGCRFMAVGDFHEGVRAALVDKDHSPRWKPNVLADVTQNQLDDLFAAMPGAELNLPLRQEMQGMRV